MTIRFRNPVGKTVTVKADRCGGEYPAGSNTYFCCFYYQGAQVARVPLKRLVPDDKAYKKLYGRPWTEKIRNADKIFVTEYPNYDMEIDGLPKDYETVWMVNYDQHTWVIQCPNRAILHVMNNDEVTRMGIDFKTALRKLFPGKKVFMAQTVVSLVEIA